MKIRLWGKAEGNNFLTPACFSVTLEENPELFFRTLNDVEHGWILTNEYANPNKMNGEELIQMAKEIIEFNGVKLLGIGQDSKGNKLWLSQNFHEYEKRVLAVDWNSLGRVSYSPPKVIKTEKREALEALKTKLEQESKTIPPAVKSIAERYNGKENIPVSLLTKLGEYYTINSINGVYTFQEKT